MGGLQNLADWLGARLFITNYRPVPLTEHVVFGDAVFRKTCAGQRQYTSGDGEGLLEKVSFGVDWEKDRMLLQSSRICPNGVATGLVSDGRAPVMSASWVRSFSQVSMSIVGYACGYRDSPI